jgi:hypothetical protein
MSDTESDIETYLVKQVEAHGGRCLKLVDMGRRGFPDRTVLWPDDVGDGPRMLFIETKTIGGKVKPWQKRYHTDLESMGFTVLTLWTKEQIDDYIRDWAPARWK